jgi:hypothetical protein
LIELIDDWAQLSLWEKGRHDGHRHDGIRDESLFGDLSCAGGRTLEAGYVG